MLKPDSPLLSTGPVVLTQTRPDSGQAVGQTQGVGVVIAQYLAGAGEGVLTELAGPLVLPQLPQGGSGHDPEGGNRTIILWRETDLVDGRVVRRVVITLDATMTTATVLTFPESVELAQAIRAAAR
jgi:hypothetical protein